jgi:dethiobiotin synthetase
MTRSWFIAGTDTAVGKTLVAVALLHAARARGLSTLGLKPVAAGCIELDDQYVNDDAWALQQASSIKPDYPLVNPVALQEPMAPHIAANREGRTLELQPLVTHCKPLLTQTDFCVVEGAGGWQVPLNATETMADLATALNCDVILVVGMRLGCINHALLTAAAIRACGLRLSGWVANHVDPDMIVPAENVATLVERLDAPLLGRIPALTAPTPQAAATYLDLEPLLR